ncbi:MULTISPECIES: negative regulator of sigma-X activity [Neobacillus]|uniref:negative regulator of sigma-X activity n=1 Tax=Neobacillus TaxID=2675232 RepID=UPI0013D21E79|nr:negative regulator of sigma-X activity [Neobacillus sedimentimangrovi]
MKKSEWSDKELIELLKEMPKVKDYRDPRDIYQKLSPKKRRTFPWLFPGIASVAALFLLFLIASNIIDNNQHSLEKLKEESTSNRELARENQESGNVINNAGILKDQSEAPKTKVTNETSVKTAVYGDTDLQDGKVLIFWIPDGVQDQNLIPVATIVNDEKNKNWLSLFNENMASLKEKEWGLSDYYPLNASLSLDKNERKVIVDVPPDHTYGQGSNQETLFINMLKKNISSNSEVKQIKFTTNGKPGIVLGNYGVVEEMDIKDEKKHAYFFYYPEGSNIPFLVPSPSVYKDINTAFDAMTGDIQEYRLERSLVPSFVINQVSTDDKKLLLTLNNNTKLKDDQMTVWSLEAVLLTAKEFGFEQVLVTNPPISNIGSFDLTKEINVPLAPNLREIQ